ncbi:MAG: FAD-dependent monooxygenase [Alphaproteobacteria bacterium]|jgi:2-polyprenyl-6-methoxyphenol hydroxylase-like FAD-dependent oxidoreductase
MTDHNTISDEFDTDVLIIGGGPVGLAMAVELGWRGIDCVLVEQGDGVVAHPKTNGINMRTMEFCRRWGIANKVRELGYPKDRPRDHIFLTSLTGWEIARQTNPSYNDVKVPDGTLEPFQRCPQTVFDPLLQARARALPSVTLRYHTRCDDLDQDDTAITAFLENTKTGMKEGLRAPFAIACEGARSPIRDRLGIKLEGTPVLGYATNVLFRSDEFSTMHNMGAGRSYMAIGPDGQWASVNSINGHDIWRLQIRGSLDPESWDKVDVDADMRRFAGRDFDYEVLSSLEWVRRQLIADRYQDRRIFLAGDCIHQLTPSGSFGMNTGIGDITNLSWKIEAALKGWAGPNLLDSYTLERQPIGKRNVDEAAARFALGDSVVPHPQILEDTPEGEDERREAGEKIAKRMIQPPSYGMQVGYRYDDSPVIIADDTPTPPLERETYTPTTRPGARAPDALLKDGQPLLDSYGKGFVLVCLGSKSGDVASLVDAAKMRNMPMDVMVIDDPKIISLYETTLVLVRPDGHVGWRGNHPPDDPGAIMDRLRGA